MNRAIQKRWTSNSRLTAGAVVRFGFALFLILQIVYTPFHLLLEPHSGDAHFVGNPAAAQTVSVVEADGHDDHGDSERHPAAQHKLKALRSHRAAPVDLVVLPVADVWIAEQDCPLPQVFVSSGLSPPEVSHSWQFIFRAALPPRAPSSLS